MLQGTPICFMIHSLDLCAARWEFCQLTDKVPQWLPAQVPGNVHKDLLAAGRIPDPFFGTNELQVQWIEEQAWEYRCSFTLPAMLAEQEHIELVAEGLDTVASVFVNDRELLRTENMFTELRHSLRPLLIPGRNELRIRFHCVMDYIRTQRQEHQPPVEFNDPVGGGTRVRKQACQFGWDWAPRLVSAGIWLPIRIEAWTGCRLQNVRVSQTHKNGAVSVRVEPELVGEAKGLFLRARLRLGETVLAEVSGPAGKALRLAVENPQLWWPSGQGAQTLHELQVDLLDPQLESPRASWVRRLGLRSIKLDRRKDRWGESFRFVVNGRPLFLKGANWIPAHSFVAGLQREDYERDLAAAVEANMNCLRVWGGGIYEHECFYDLCDELGLLVWQDFMFACTLHPHDPAFLELVQAEARHQVARLRHRACLALWCGNNEIAQINPKTLEDAATRQGYEKLFHDLLPKVVEEVDGITDYWPSSAWGGRFGFTHEDSEKQGDCHFWEVWHARKPVSEYEKYLLRFCSEFGMQSYPSWETLLGFCPPGDRNLLGASAENHQKNPHGNQIILDYVTRRYGAAKSPDDLCYLSQLNQAYCMQVAVEHYRRNMPRCMGALYWQLNDCWPCASWSSLEHNGRWKALHHAARRFYAPCLLSAKVEGAEHNGKGNYRVSSFTGRVVLHTVSDFPEPVDACIRWRLHELDTGRCLREGSHKVRLNPGEAREALALDFGTELAAHGRDNLVLQHGLWHGDSLLSGDSAFFAEPRFLRLQKPQTQIRSSQGENGALLLHLQSPVFQHRVEIQLPGLPFHCSDNYFDLYPNTECSIELWPASKLSPAALRKQVRLRSLADAQ